MGVLLSYPFSPESQRWLVYRDRFDEAEVVIKDLYGSDYNAIEEGQLLHLQIEEQRALNKATSVTTVFEAKICGEQLLL
jgi:hypothetical protein